MRIGIFADSHDHLANIRLAVQWFNQEHVDLVLFAGDLGATSFRRSQYHRSESSRPRSWRVLETMKAINEAC